MRVGDAGRDDDGGSLICVDKKKKEKKKKRVSDPERKYILTSGRVVENPHSRKAERTQPINEEADLKSERLKGRHWYHIGRSCGNGSPIFDSWNV
jgi:hypothetical protein